VDRQLIGREDMLLWLLRGDLKGETGSEIMAGNKILTDEFRRNFLIALLTISVFGKNGQKFSFL